MHRSMMISVKGPTPQFCIESGKPTRFYLKGETSKESTEEAVVEKSGIKERDLHPYLVSFVKNDPHFYCYSKTIREGTASSKYLKQNQWMYPDIVGVHYPFEDDYDPTSYELFENLKQNSVKIYSFELKLSITTSDVR